MTPWRPSAWPVLWQTLLLLVAAVLIAQAIGIALLFWLPSPRPDFNRLSDVSAVLLGQPADSENPDVALHPRLQHDVPAAPDGLIVDPGLTTMLARRVDRPEDQVRLFVEPDRSRLIFPFVWRPRDHDKEGGKGDHDGERRRRREPILFGRVQAAVATPAGWRIAETPPPPLVAPWQRRVILWFAASAIVLVPLAWLFARRISQPIRRFAGAADRMRADPGAPAVPEEGPAELRVTARALNRMQGRLATHLSERTAMIGAIAHDLRTPLARIAFRVETAPEPMREKVLGDIEQMRAMIAATIGFARHTGGSEAHVPVDLAALLSSIVHQDHDMGRDVRLGEIAPLGVTGDPLALSRLFQNLIDNGLAYGKSVEASLRAEGDCAIVTIADRGPGLPADKLERMFDPFVRGDPSRNRETGGIGLGLTIARAIAEEHGGRVKLAARAGGGLEAITTLPLAT